MLIALKNENVKEYINSDHIVSFWDGVKEQCEGVFIAMVDDSPDNGHRHFTAFVYGTIKFNSDTLREFIEKGK